MTVDLRVLDARPVQNFDGTWTVVVVGVDGDGATQSATAAFETREAAEADAETLGWNNNKEGGAA